MADIFWRFLMRQRDRDDDVGMLAREAKSKALFSNKTQRLRSISEQIAKRESDCEMLIVAAVKAHAEWLDECRKNHDLDIVYLHHSKIPFSEENPNV